MNVVAKPPLLLDPAKFRDPSVTAKGEKRARVAFRGLATLWFNTGTLCNLTCPHCYIESSPRNDRLVHLTASEVAVFLDQLDRPIEIGFTGGEPFMNPDFMVMVEDALARGHRALILTNAMKPMRKREAGLLALRARFGERLALRVSLDHPTAALHDLERGKGGFNKSLGGLAWLAGNGFTVSVASRGLWGESEARLRAGFADLFARESLALDAQDPDDLVIFPEMDASLDVPEITEACWGLLKKSPDAMMCAASRMVVKRKGADRPGVVACTLLPYEAEFEIGTSLAEAARDVALNHPHCARFCVLGGGACSRHG